MDKVLEPMRVMEALPERATAQHALARIALPIIGEVARAGSLIRYGDLAESIGRSRSNARAIAQACNLLDSAANHARRPLMALWTVRSQDWQVNDAAWRTEAPDLRQALLDQAEHHRFTLEDETAIAVSLNAFKGFGAQKAWEQMSALVPYDQLLNRLLQREPPAGQDSLNDLDLGSDIPISEPTAGRRFVRNPRVRAAVLNRADGRCEFCGQPGFTTYAGTPYLETHHILALSQDGEDRVTNVIALCPLDHRRAHLSADRRAIERQMVRIVQKKTQERELIYPSGGSSRSV